MAKPSLTRAVEVFVHGFCFGRSIKHPYEAQKIAELWVLRDAPGAKNPRKTEVIAHGIVPWRVLTKISELVPEWHFVCHMYGPEESGEQIRAGYKAAGYRAIATEWTFGHDLEGIPEVASDPPVRRVLDPADAGRIAKAAGGRQIRDEDLLAEQPKQRLYTVMDSCTTFGWVSSIPIGDAAWVANLFVDKRHRGRGFGRALMSKLLLDDRQNELAASYLMASSAGRRLYPHLGYEQIGAMQIFCPAKRPEKTL
ncbi:MAG: GNAT family N-acetyltransferase [Armatimonadetes bacterium]|nr:GNAT family N-acetyltransferase [Armatimonadota bacterium]